MEIKTKSCTPIPFFISVVIFSLLNSESCGHTSSPSFYNEIKVGLILDMGSWTGKTVHSCVKMAISDFYGFNNHYTTRIALHTRDSGADPMHAISSGLDLVENMKVQVIIVLETSLVTKILAALGDKANIPIFSFSSILSSSGAVHRSLVQIKQDDISQFKGIATIVKSFKWRSVTIIFEDSDDGREVIPHLVDSLQEANVHIASKTAISPFSTDDQIHDELRKLISLQPTIYIVHMSQSLASRLFLSSKRLGMMKEGYAWIVTDKTMNQFRSLDSEVVESSLQGVIGLKAYIPSSTKLRNLTLRWKEELYGKNNPLMELSNNIELDVLGIWAYDTIWALAESVEKECTKFLNAANKNSSDIVGVANPYSGTRLLEEIRQIRFTGLSGKFQILDGRLHSKALAIVNVVGTGERKVGFWTPKHGLVKEMHPLVKRRSLYLSSARRSGLEDVIWPGGSAIPPKGWRMLTRGRKLRILVTSSEGYKELINVYRDAQTNTTTVTGFCADVFKAAIDSLDYQVPYEFIPLDPEYGQNLRYSDLINLVYRQMFDGIVLDMTITANRSLYVDFTIPYTDLGVGTITKRESNDMWVFLKPLRPSLWFTAAAFFVLTGLVVWAIEHPTNVEFQGSVVHQIGTILWFGFSTLVYAHREKLTSNLSRFVVTVWLFVVLILTSSYTATLSSTLTVRQIQFIGTQFGSFLGGAIANNTNFKDNQLQLYSTPEAYADALSRGGKKGGVDGIIDEIPYIKIFLAKYGDKYEMVATHSITNGFGFVFQKGSPLVSDMSRAIVKLRENGTLARMERTWFKSQSSFMPDDAATTPSVLNLDRFSGLFLISWLCCILALLIHLIPILLNKLRVVNVIDELLRRGVLAVLLQHLAPRNGNAIELVNVR